MSNLHTPVTKDLLPLPPSDGNQSPLANTARRGAVAEEALEDDPENPLLWNILGTVIRPGELAVVAGRTYTKQQCFERALEVDPDDTVAWNNLGELEDDEEENTNNNNNATQNTNVEGVVAANDDNDGDDVGSHNNTIITDGPEVGFSTPSRPQAPGVSLNNTLNNNTAASLDNTMKSAATTTTLNNTANGSSLPSSPSKRDCFIRALELDPDHSQAWSNLGRQMPNTAATTKKNSSNNTSTPPTDTVSVAGISYTKQQCYEKALEVDPRNAGAWYNLAEMTPPSNTKGCAGGTISIHSTTGGAGNTVIKMTRQQCLEKVLEIDPKHPTAWSQLADTIPATTTNNNSIKGGGGGVATIRGKEYTKQECVERALEVNPTGNAAAWSSLILSIPAGSGGTVTLNGKTLTRQACYEKLLDIDGKRPLAWYNLGNELPAGGSAMVGRVPVSKQRCYENAVEVDPRNAAAWNSLGSELMKQSSDNDNNSSTKVTKQQCFINALEVDPLHALAWYNLSTCMNTAANEDVAVVEVSGEKLTKINCFEKVLELHPRHPTAWGDLAHALDTTVSTTTTAKVASTSGGTKKGSVEVTYTTYTRQQCIEKLLEVRPRTADGWVELIDMIQAANQEATIATVGGQKHSLLQCYEKLLDIDGKRPLAWYNLGSELPEGGSAMVGKTLVSKRRCFEKAVEVDPRHADAWNSLGILLIESSPLGSINGNDSFSHTINTPRKKAPVSYNPEKCFIKTVSSNPTSSAAWNNAGIYLASAQKNSNQLNNNNTAVVVEAAAAIRKKCTDDQDDTTTSQGTTALWIPASQGGGAEVCTVQDCFVKAVELNPLSSNAWNNLGTSIPRGGNGVSVTTTNTTSDDVDSDSSPPTTSQCIITKLDCFKRAVELNPSHATAWNNLGGAVESRVHSSAGGDEEDDSSSSCTVVTIKGTTYTRQQCIEKSLMLSGGGVDTLETWINAFNTIPDTSSSESSTIFFIDEALTKKECAIKILDLYYFSHVYPSQQSHIVGAIASIWAYLGDTMMVATGPGDDEGHAITSPNTNTVIVFNGKEYTQKLCYEIALTALLTSASSSSPTPSTSTPVSSTPDTDKTIHNNNNAVAESSLYLSTMQSLAEILHKEGDSAVANIKGQYLSKVQCYVAILETVSGRRNTTVWNNLGLALVNDAAVTIDGEVFTEQRCYETSLGFDSEDEVVWTNLGITIGGIKVVAVVGGQEYTQEQCFQRADEIAAAAVVTKPSSSLVAAVE